MDSSFFSFFEAANAYLRAHPEHMLEVYFKEYERFQCSRCAQCCTLPWNIGVSESYFNHWDPIFKRHPDSRFHQALVPVTADHLSHYFAYLNKQADGLRCILLDEDNLCLAQKHFGLEGKPEVCRNYPYLSNLNGQQFKVSHLMQSCRSAPEYLLQTPELVYRMVPQSPALPGYSFYPLHAFSGLRFSRETFYLWLGFQLDTLWFECERRSPIQNLRALIPVFRRLLVLRHREYHRGYYEISPAQLTQLYQQHMTYMKHTPPQYCLRKASVIEWYLEVLPHTIATEDIRNLYTQILSGQKLWPALTLEEQNLLQTFLHHYLTRLLLSCTFWLNGRLNLLQQHLFFTQLSCLLQLQTLVYRELTQTSINARMLGMSLNLIEAQIVQSQTWIEKQGLPLKTSEACLEQIDTFLTLDLTISHPNQQFQWSGKTKRMLA